MALLSLFDTLYCQEENLELEEDLTEALPPVSDCLDADHHLLSAAEVSEEEWTQVLCSLLAKEGGTHPEIRGECIGGDSAYLPSTRRDAVEWVSRAVARHAFSTLTALLVVNYLDRCFLSSVSGRGGLQLQEDKPWMGRLAAVACLSLAAKVEETRVPLLLDLQVTPPTPAPAEEDNCYVFDAKTIGRMELLVLSALGWRMNPVTPMSFIHHLLLRLYYKDNNNGDATAAGIAARICELVKRCEAVFLSVIADWRWVRYKSSVWAAAALLHATETGGGAAYAADSAAAAALEPHKIHYLIALLNVPMEEVEECYLLIQEAMVSDSSIIGHKRKHSDSSHYYYSSPLSPTGVIGSCFSCESSSSSGGDSWATMWPSSVSSSEIRPFKLPICIANKGFTDQGMGEDSIFSSVSII